MTRLTENLHVHWHVPLCQWTQSVVMSQKDLIPLLIFCPSPMYRQQHGISLRKLQALCRKDSKQWAKPSVGKRSTVSSEFWPCRPVVTHVRSTFNTNSYHYILFKMLVHLSNPHRCVTFSRLISRHHELGPSRRSHWPPNPPNWTLASTVAHRHTHTHTHTQACLKIHKTSALSPPPLELFGWEAFQGNLT